MLILTDGKNEQVYLSARNVSTLNVLPFGEESVYDVLWAETVVIERSALENGASRRGRGRARGRRGRGRPTRRVRCVTSTT